MKLLKMLLIAGLSILPVIAFSQDVTKNKTKAQKQKIEKIKYSCLMHPEVTRKKPGKCPKCGMTLTKATKEKIKANAEKVYTCPMHPEVTSNKPGSCPKCNMDLVEKKEDHSNHQH